MKVYISGAITGREKQARKRFADVAEDLKRNGYEVYNPCDLKLKQRASHEDFMEKDIVHLCTCDIVYFLTGWEHSHGCRYEHQVALATGKRIAYECPEHYRLSVTTPTDDFNNLVKVCGLNVEELQGRVRNWYVVAQRIAVITYMITHTRASFYLVSSLIKRSPVNVRYLYNQRLKREYDDSVRSFITEWEKKIASSREPKPYPVFEE